MATLADALAWAGRGFPVFPIAEGTKDQPLVDQFYDTATCDPATIAAWWRDPLTGAERNHNIGVSTTGLVVPDMDVRNGKQGIQTFLEHGGHLGTLVVKTPSGGLHAYFHGPHAANAQSLFGADSGLDVRSWHGYTLAPGSATAEGTYSVEIDLPLAEIPESLRVHLRAPQDRVGADHIAIAETSAMTERAVAFLSTTPPAIEGAGGDSQTFMTAARLRDLGIAETSAVDLMLIYYNPRCSPPWDADEIKVKVANAYAYGTAPFGIMAPETHYGSLAIPEGSPHDTPITETNKSLTSPFQFGNAVDPLTLPPRPWLYTNLLMRSNVTVVTGAGSAGKSLMQLTIAAHLAMGLDMAGFKLRGALPKKSIIYNGEDDIDEQTRRLYAICLNFKFDWPTVRDRIALVCKKMLRFQLATADQYGKPEINSEHIQQLVDAAADPDVGFISLDAMVQLHQSKEEDNPAMRYIVEAAARIAEVTDTAIALVHHVGKPSAASKMGDMYAARGGSEIINAARVGVNLAIPSVADVASGQWPIEMERRNEYVAMADAKLNYGLAGKVKWWKKKGIRIPSGDEVGVLDPFDMTSATAAHNAGHATLIAVALRERGTATCSMGEAGDLLKAVDALIAKMSPGELRAKMMSVLAEPIATEYGTIRSVQDNLGGGKWATRVVLE